VERDVYREIMTRLQEDLLPRIYEIPAFYELFEERQKEEHSESLQASVSIAVEKAIKKGFRPVWRGEEILEAVQARKRDILHNTVLSLSEQIIGTIISKSDIPGRKILPFPLYLFLIFSLQEPGVRRDAYSYLFGNDDYTKIHFIDDANEMDGLSGNGLDYYSELFFNIFYSDYAREDPRLKNTESIMTVSL